MPEERTLYRVVFVYYAGPVVQRRAVGMDVSTHPLRRHEDVIEDVRELLTEKGYDLREAAPSIKAVGVEISREG
ncbi:hypothetical protein SMD44_07352 [Streptomyces alboflavus]|uniref:Uncharacterized protein n=1 Tax=Streptomyces alboflavus TaxID=67267 RepID=A0A1Z1WNB9_9ACTN|nr:hypothetical protein [Streptomyces alboflavus]ARX87870.1 hypothetical protein SMD44_07352 [Streptomyces alboflavus]